MGWKFTETYRTNPSQNGEEKDTHKLVVEGNSISDTLTFECRGEIIEIEVSTLRQIVNDLNRYGVL